MWLTHGEGRLMIRELFWRWFQLQPLKTDRSEMPEEDRSTLAHLVKLLREDEAPKAPNKAR
jgi:hypothetical protein